MTDRPHAQVTLPADERLRNFRRWFGESKVVDKEGKPLVVYHGTSRDFTEFRRKARDIGMHFGTAAQANERIENKTFEGHSASGQRLMPVYLAISNPLRLPDLTIWDAESVTGALFDAGFATIEELDKATSLPKLRALIEKKGYDGIVYRNEWERVGSAAMLRREFERREELYRQKPVWHHIEPEWQELDRMKSERIAFTNAGSDDSYIAFHPEQIKSAIGNSGRFDPQSASLTDEIESPLTMATIAPNRRRVRP